MRIQIFTIFIALFTQLSSNTVRAQQLPANLRFNKFTTENGLPDNRISTIMKDKNGYLWIATQNGISRFDGVEFKNFQHNAKDNNSLLSNLTGNLAEDSLGRIWIATYHGLSAYNPATGKFWNYSPPEKEFIKNTAIWILKAQDGSIWFSTWNKLNTIDLRSLRITSFLIDSTAPDKNNVSIGLFFEAGNGDFWFDSNKGIQVFNRHNHTVTRLSGRSGLSGMYDDGKGQIYFAGWGAGLKEYHIKTKKTTEYFLHNPKLARGDSTRAITWISHASTPQFKNYLWVSTEIELAVFDMEKKRFVRFFQFDSSRQSVFPESWIGRTFADGHDNFWLASADGLYVASLDQFDVTNYYLPQTKASRGNVTRVRQDVNDTSILWASVSGSGIFKIDRRTGNILQSFLPEDETRYTDSNRDYVYDFLQLKSGEIWMAAGCSLSYYNPSTGKNYFIKTPHIASFAGHLNGTYSLVPKSDSDCWISTDAGIGSFNFINHTFKLYPHYNATPEMSDEHYVKLLKKDKDGNIWFYNHNDGFFMYNPQQSKFTRINIPGVKLKDLVARSITQTPDSTIWLSADDQLFYKKRNDSSFHNANLASINSFLFDMASDQKNDLYLLTFSGLVKYEKETGELTTFTVKDGLILRNAAGLDTSADGKIFLKGINYFSELNALKFTKKYEGSPLIFESVSINGKDSFINFDEYKTRFLHLGYEQNQITLRFRLMNFRDPAQTNYYCKLDGWDKNWVSSGTGNYIAYSNLPGGDYTLHVKAINPDGSENPEEATLMIHIDKPFWKTWWFYSLCVLMMIALLYFIYTLRMQRRLAVEKIRSKISRDLHDDVGSTLTSINIWSDVAGRQLETDAAKSAEYIGRIRNSSQNMLDNMNDIIWAINPVNDTLEKVLIRMKLYASEMLEPKDISFLFAVDNEIKGTIIPMQYRREWYLIFKEAINNAAKYSQAKNVEVRIAMHQHNLNMQIKDDGKGFLLDENNQGNGLRNMKQRAQKMNAALRIHSSPGNGTEIILEQKFT